MAILSGIKKTGRVLPALLVAILALSIPVDYAAQEQDEYEVKAAFIFNFLKFMEWPQTGASGNFEICILGDDPFEKTLDQLTKGKSAFGRPIQVRRIKDPVEARSCQIAFASSAERAKAAKLIDAVRGTAVLTVGETPGFAERGGVIRFVLEDNRVRFEINVEAAHQADLTISSRLLTLARIIQQANADARKPG